MEEIKGGDALSKTDHSADFILLSSFFYMASYLLISRVFQHGNPPFFILTAFSLATSAVNGGPGKRRWIRRWIRELLKGKKVSLQLAMLPAYRLFPGVHSSAQIPFILLYLFG